MYLESRSRRELTQSSNDNNSTMKSLTQMLLRVFDIKKRPTWTRNPRIVAGKGNVKVCYNQLLLTYNASNILHSSIVFPASGNIGTFKVEVC